MRKEDGFVRPNLQPGIFSRIDTCKTGKEPVQGYTTPLKAGTEPSPYLQVEDADDDECQQEQIRGQPTKNVFSRLYDSSKQLKEAMPARQGTPSRIPAESRAEFALEGTKALFRPSSSGCSRLEDPSEEPADPSSVEQHQEQTAEPVEAWPNP